MSVQNDCQLIPDVLARNSLEDFAALSIEAQIDFIASLLKTGLGPGHLVTAQFGFLLNEILLRPTASAFALYAIEDLITWRRKSLSRLNLWDQGAALRMNQSELQLSHAL